MKEQFSVYLIKLLVIPYLVLTGFNISAQDDFLEKVIPPTPDASVLGKYGQYPVGYHTGIPNISIPIAELTGRKLSVPVSMSYHASGIKVDEIASWLGLGWNLNAGGVITRSVIGLPDDGSNGFYNETPVHANNISYNQTDYQYLLDVSQNFKDTESDYYFYNFNGRSGKFLLDDSKEAFLIPKSAIKVDLSNYPTKIAITDENGTIYKFEDKETLTVGDGLNFSSHTSAWYLTEMVSADASDHIYFYYTTDTEYVENTFSHSEAIGTKHISNLPNPPSTQYNVHDVSTPASQSVRKINAPRLSSIVSTLGKITFTKATGRLDLPTSRLSSINVYGTTTANADYVLIKSFDFSNNAHFSYNNGQTINNADPLQHRMKLNGLVEKDASGATVKSHDFTYNSTLLPPKGSFSQDHWGYNNGKTTNGSFIPTKTEVFDGHTYYVGNANRNPVESKTKACMLERVDFPTGGYTEFEFEANKYIGSTEVSQSESASAAEMNNTTQLLTETKYVTPTKSGWATLSTTCSNVTDAQPFFSTVTLRRSGTQNYLVNHVYTPYLSHCTGWCADEYSREFVVFLEKGFQYELIAQAKGNSDSQEWGGAAYSLSTLSWKEEVSGSSKTAGGLRVKSIKSYTASGASPIVKTYKYGENESGNGILIMANDDLEYGQVKTARLGHFAYPATTCVYVTSQRKYFSRSTLLDLTALSGSPVVYRKVTEYIGDNTVNEGKVIHTFDVEQDRFVPVSSGYKNGTIQLNDSWKGGSEIATQYYKYGNANDPVKTENKSYGISSFATLKRFKAGDLLVHSGCRLTTPAIGGEFYWFDYDVESGAKLLSYSESTTFPSGTSTGSDGVTSWESYTYDDDNFQMVKKSLIASDGKTYETNYQYPKDYTYASNSVLDKMVDKNIVALPIEVSQSVDGQVLSSRATKYVYDATNDYVLPGEIFVYETTTPGSGFTASSDGVTFSSYESKATILSRDAKGNVLSQQLEDNAVTSFVWGYNRSLPVAKIVGASYSVVETALGGSTGVNNIQNQTGATLRTSLNDLLTASSLSGALVTIYTYDPMVGMTSQTDPNGIITYYEYDDFGRLKLVKDDNGDIVKKQSYNYKN